MGYNWEGKEAECYRLYVEERKSLDEVIHYWEQRGFTPSKRAFQTQFKRWDFPSKQNPAYKNPALVTRVKQLWESNVTQKDMLTVLDREGFHINDRELLRLRLRFKWLMRESRKKDSDIGTPLSPATDAQQLTDPNTLHGPLQTDAELPLHRSATPSSTPDERRPRKDTRDTEEPHRLTKRRRTRSRSCPPVSQTDEPTRFPSETTLDEAKTHLFLSHDQYRNIRKHFQELCEQEGVVKKRHAGPSRWNLLKAQLAQGDAHLRSIFHPESVEQEGAAGQDGGGLEELVGNLQSPQALSLDVICTDVTKRLRSHLSATRLSIPEAKNVLGLNPAEARRVRAQLHGILVAERFPSMHDAGDEQWREVKEKWIRGSELLTRVLEKGGCGDDEDERYKRKAKAADILARDVMKRYRAEVNGRGHGGHEKAQMERKATAPQALLIPAQPDEPARPPERSTEISTSKSTATPAAPSTTEYAAASHSASTSRFFGGTTSPSDLQIDPSLLLAANASNPSMLLGQPHQGITPMAHRPSSRATNAHS